MPERFPLALRIAVAEVEDHPLDRSRCAPSACPSLEAEVAVAVGEEAIGRAVELTLSLLPGVIATGVARKEEIDIDTLADRLRADTGAVGRLVFWPTVVGAFATKPA